MPPIDQATVRNRLLAALPPGDFAALAPALEPAELAFKQVLHAPDQPIGPVHFPETGMVSMLAGLDDGQAMEVGLVGREGLVGLSVLLGDGGPAPRPWSRRPAAPGASRRRRSRPCSTAAPAVRTLLLRYAQAFHVQVAQTAACNGRHALEERLARWLLMAHDRAEGDVFPMTHEFLALMLGVRRAGVTVAAGVLHRRRHRLRARHVTVLDRPGLEGAACGCHGAGAAAVRAPARPAVG